MVDLFNLKATGIDKDLSHYNFTITGQFGAGKSTFANELFNKISGDVVVFGFEDRFKGINGIRVVRMTSWDDARAYLKQIKKGVKENGRLPFKTVIIDPVGVAGAMCMKYICKREGVSEIGDISYGGGYSMFKTEYEGYIDELRALGIKVEQVSHGRMESIKPPRGEEYNVFTTDVPKQLIYKTQGEVDFLLYLTVIREVDDVTGKSIPKRRLYLQNYADYDLKVPVTSLPDYIDYENVKDGVNQFIDAFENAVNQENKLNNFTEKVNEPEETNTVASENIDEIRENAVSVREGMLKKNGGSYLAKDVKKILEDELGTYKIAECENESALKEFIDKYK